MPLPPSMTGQPSPGFSPASSQSGNPGEVATALAQVRQAVMLLQAILPKLPIGSEPHQKVTKMIEMGAKLVPQADQQPGIQNTALEAMKRQMQQSQPQQNVMAAMGGGQPSIAGPQQQAA